VDLTKRGSLNDVLRWMIIDGIGEKKIDAANRPDRYTIIDTQIRRARFRIQMSAGLD